jgi:hypothetical protein
MKSTRSLLRFVVPVLFVTLVGGFVARNSGLFSCSEPGNNLPEATKQTPSEEDSILVFPESKAKDTLPNPFPDSPAPERQTYFPSSKSAGPVIPFDQLPFGNQVDDRPVRIIVTDQEKTAPH